MAQIPLRPYRRPYSANGAAGTINGLDTYETPKPHTVSAQELQARIKAARRKKAATPAPLVPAHLNPRRPHNLNAPVYSRILPDGHHERPTNIGGPRRDPVYIDSVIERLQTENRPSQPSPQTDRPVQKNHTLPIHDSVVAVDSILAYRPRPNRTTSNRSSMVVRKSPLSTVSLLDEPTDLPATNSSRSSSQSSSSSYSPSSGSLDTIRPDFPQVNLTKAPKYSEVITASDPPRHKNRMSWLHFSRRSNVSTL
ncbi:hypothetical protein NX059_000298 [Plenodomus lindquistii]|nr:hypothetical protein NX059_000298 [Plenodomus lindquistii]